MNAYLWTMLVLNALALIGWLNTKPGAPRPPQSSRQIAFGAAISTAFMAWAIALLLGAAP